MLTGAMMDVETHDEGRSAARIRGAFPADAESYHYVQCGVSGVYLRGGVVRASTPYGTGVSITNADELHQAIGLHLVTGCKVLTGSELRFLRKQMDLTQAELAAQLRVREKEVSAWEREQDCIPGPADLLLRLRFLKHIRAPLQDPLAQLEALGEQDSEISETAVFAWTDHGWERVPRA